MCTAAVHVEEDRGVHCKEIASKSVCTAICMDKNFKLKPSLGRAETHFLVLRETIGCT